jgi:hypothetical protein
LIRYGFGDMVRRMGLANGPHRAGRAPHWSNAEEFAHLPPPARVRRALEDLGPAFIELGQVLATRVDLFEPAPPVPYGDIRQQTEDLGAPPEEVFAAFDSEPVAAALIAQVHRARLDDGSEVVVKVRRPAICPIIQTADYRRPESRSGAVFRVADDSPALSRAGRLLPIAYDRTGRKHARHLHNGELHRLRLVGFQIRTEFFDCGFGDDPILRAQRIQLSVPDEVVRPADAYHRRIQF